MLLSLFRKAKKRDSPSSPTPPIVLDIFARADAAAGQGDHSTARALYAQALSVDPQNLYAFFQLADSHLAGGDLARAKEFCEQGLTIDPRQIGLLLLLAQVASRMSDPLLALRCYEKVATIDPDVEGLDAYLADQYCLLGRVREGVAAFDRALARTPEETGLQTNRLFVLNYAELLSPEQLFEEHRRWGSAHEARLRDARVPIDVERNPTKRLRVGYVSPDFRTHAVAYFIESLLCEHDKTTFEILCFDTSPGPEDVTTQRIKRYGHMWQRAAGLDNAALAATIRQSRVDILVDLSGHTRDNRLLAFARKPAPVQATWLGYLNTTGLTSMDYRITDAFLDPPGTTEHLHTETLVRLKNQACLTPPDPSPPVATLPALRTQRITFGSVNNWVKVSDAAKDTWATIIRKAGHARLLIVAAAAQNDEFRRLVVSDFVSRGVSAEQVVMYPFLPLTGFLQLLAEVDIGLDPFPYGGGTTTMHCLWMGVPVVTLAGKTAFARNSVGLLNRVGLSHLVAADLEAYVKTALDLAADLRNLAGIRSGLRDRVRTSSLIDGKQFALNIEEAYRAMWTNYCRGTRETIDVG